MNFKKILKLSKIISFIFLFSFFNLFFNFSQIKAQGWFWLSGWSYRRPITIDNTASSSALTDYQVLVTLDTHSLISAGKMDPTCKDIRFTDSDGTTLISYWIESGCDTASTRIWVKVPFIPASSNKTIYVYYGNPSAPSGSDGKATFVFFEDFNDADAEWNYSGSGHTYSLNSSDAHSSPESAYLKYNRGGCDEGYLYTTINLPNSDLILEFWDKVSTKGWNTPIGIKFNDDWIWCYDGTSYAHAECDRSAHDWAKQTIDISSYKNSTITFKIYHKDTTTWCNQFDHDTDIHVDDIIIRKTTSFPPTVKPPGAEEAAPTPTSTSTPSSSPSVVIREKPSQCCKLSHDMTSIDPTCREGEIVAPDTNVECKWGTPTVTPYKWGLCCTVDAIYTVADYIFWIFFIIAVIAFVVAGYFFIVGGADPGTLSKAKAMVFWGSIAVVVVVLSKVIPAAIKAIVR